MLRKKIPHLILLAAMQAPMCLGQDLPLFFIGMTGAGKTTVVNKLLDTSYRVRTDNIGHELPDLDHAPSLEAFSDVTEDAISLDDLRTENGRVNTSWMIEDHRQAPRAQLESFDILDKAVVVDANEAYDYYHRGAGAGELISGTTLRASSMFTAYRDLAEKEQMRFPVRITDPKGIDYDYCLEGFCTDKDKESQDDFEKAISARQNLKEILCNTLYCHFNKWDTHAREGSKPPPLAKTARLLVVVASADDIIDGLKEMKENHYLTTPLAPKFRGKFAAFETLTNVAGDQLALVITRASKGELEGRVREYEDNNWLGTATDNDSDALKDRRIIANAISQSTGINLQAENIFFMENIYHGISDKMQTYLRVKSRGDRRLHRHLQQEVLNAHDGLSAAEVESKVASLIEKINKFAEKRLPLEYLNTYEAVRLLHLADGKRNLKLDNMERRIAHHYSLLDARDRSCIDRISSHGANSQLENRNQDLHEQVTKGENEIARLGKECERLWQISNQNYRAVSDVLKKAEQNKGLWGKSLGDNPKNFGAKEAHLN